MIVLFRICPAGSLLVIDRVRVSYDVFFRIVQDGTYPPPHDRCFPARSPAGAPPRPHCIRRRNTASETRTRRTAPSHSISAPFRSNHSSAAYAVRSRPAFCGKHIFLQAILGDPRALEQRKNIACLRMLGALPLCLRLPLRVAVIPRLVAHRHHTVVQPERIRQPRKLRRVQIAQMIDRIVVFILDRESADLFCKIRLNCQNAVLKGIWSN